MDIGRELQALRKRIDDVERIARLSRASLDNTSIVVKDATGAVKGHIGMQTDGTVALVTQDGPAPGAPTAPLVTSTIGGLAVAWDGALADGSPLPADFDHVAVHVSTTSGFTPSAATFAGTITRSGDGGTLPVVPLPYQPHYVVLVAVNSSNIAGNPSAETTATPLQVDGPDLAAGSVTAATIEAGSVTADKLEAVLELVTRLVAGDPAGARVELNGDGLRVYDPSGTLVIRFDSADGSAAFTGNITGSTVSGSTVTGGLIQTATSGERVTINESGANQIVVYDASGTPVGSFSAMGARFKGTSGAYVLVDPNSTYPNVRWSNSTGSNWAYVQVVESVAGDANVELISGQFNGNSYPDMRWRNYLGNDFAVIERLRFTDPSHTAIGGRLFMDATHANLHFINGDNTAQTTQLNIYANYVQLDGGRIRVLPPASSNNALYVEGDPAHTGNLLGLYRDGAYRFTVDKDGNTNVGNILTAGNIAAGRTTITPSAANVPTSVNVTGLTLKGTTVRVIATPSTAVPGSQVLGVGVTNQATNGFTMWLTRNNTNATSIDWIAYAV